jgi:hypothetical protein
MSTGAVKHAANEQRDDQMRRAGQMQAVIAAIDSISPENPSAVTMWACARNLAHQAMMQEWNEALRASPVEVPT